MEARIAGHAHELMVGQTAGLPTEARLGVAEGYLREVLSLKAHELAFQDSHFALAIFFLVGAVTSVLMLRRS